MRFVCLTWFITLTFSIINLQVFPNHIALRSSESRVMILLQSFLLNFKLKEKIANRTGSGYANGCTRQHSLVRNWFLLKQNSKNGNSLDVRYFNSWAKYFCTCGGVFLWSFCDYFKTSYIHIIESIVCQKSGAEIFILNPLNQKRGFGIITVCLCSALYS